MDGVPVAVGSLCPEFLWLHNLSDSAYILSVGPKWPVNYTLDVVQFVWSLNLQFSTRHSDLHKNP
jgi:hypothetical protein